MEWILLSALVTIVVLALVIILLLRMRSSMKIGRDVETEKRSYPDVEYEWSAGGSSLPQLILFVILIIVYGVVVLADNLFNGEELDFGSLIQLFLFSLGIFFSMIGVIWKKKTYQITTEGLFLLLPEKKGERKMLFSWDNLLWFKPDNKGFRYYLKVDAKSADLTAAMAFPMSNRVNCGRHATLVNSLIMARGIPTSPPGKSNPKP